MYYLDQTVEGKEATSVFVDAKHSFALGASHKDCFAVQLVLSHILHRNGPLCPVSHLAQKWSTLSSLTSCTDMVHFV